MGVKVIGKSKFPNNFTPTPLSEIATNLQHTTQNLRNMYNYCSNLKNFSTKVLYKGALTSLKLGCFTRCTSGYISERLERAHVVHHRFIIIYLYLLVNIANASAIFVRYGVRRVWTVWCLDLGYLHLICQGLRDYQVRVDFSL